MIPEYPEIKIHQIIITGNNNFFETDNSCSENYYHDILQIPDYKDNKYEPDLINSKIMKNSHICSFNLKID